MARKFKELLANMSKERRDKIAAKTNELIQAMSLEELREAQSLTQKTLAELLEIDQAAVSKLEHRADTYVSTLRRYVQAMGGQLEIRATFPSGTVLIDQFTGEAPVIAFATREERPIERSRPIAAQRERRSRPAASARK